MVVSEVGRLCVAAAAGRVEVVKQLVSRNEALLRAADDDGLYPGFTALHWCALGMPQADSEKLSSAAHLEVALLLMDEDERLSKGGDDEQKVMDIPDLAGDTPLHVAISWGQVELAQLMIQRGGSKVLTTKNKNKMTPMDLAQPALKAKLK